MQLLSQMNRFRILEELPELHLLLHVVNLLACKLTLAVCLSFCFLFFEKASEGGYVVADQDQGLHLGISFDLLKVNYDFFGFIVVGVKGCLCLSNSSPASD